MMTVQWQWTMDPQQADAVCTCTRCGGEIYGSDSDLCDACEEEAHSLDTIVKYARRGRGDFSNSFGARMMMSI